MRVGVVALQGDFPEHAHMLRRAADELSAEVEVVLVKGPHHLRDLDALILTGGESTTIGLLASRAGLLEPLREYLSSGMPALGTCAGAILMAKDVKDAVVGPTSQPTLGVMDISVVRNAFGRQKDSFEADIDVEGIGRVRGIFIRAPAIVGVWGATVPLAHLNHPRTGRIIVLAQEGPLIASSFHPELSSPELHKHLLNLAKK